MTGSSDIPPPEAPLTEDSTPAPTPAPQQPRAYPSQEEFIMNSLQALPKNNRGPNGQTWYPRQFIHDYLVDKGKEYNKYYNPESIAHADYWKAQTEEIRNPKARPMNELDRSTAALQSERAKELARQGAGGGRPPPSPGPEPTDPAEVQRLVNEQLKLEMPDKKAAYTKLTKNAEGEELEELDPGYWQWYEHRREQLEQKFGGQQARAAAAAPPPAATVQAPIVPPPPAPGVKIPPTNRFAAFKRGK